MQTEPASKWFRRHLRTVLNALYDPAVLRSSPLVELFDLQQRSNTVSAFQRNLTDAIEALRPNERTPGESRTWRVYQILRRRYTEQVPQRKVAADLGLSVRQLQREEKVAREVLADYLWSTHGLDSKLALLASGPEAPVGASSADGRAPSRAQELAVLRDTVPHQMADIGEVIRGVIGTIHPLLQATSVSMECALQDDVPRLPLQVPLLRQALLNIITTASRCVPGGQVQLEAHILAQQVCIDVRAVAHGRASSLQLPDCSENLQIAQQLVRHCGGSLEVALDEGGRTVLLARIMLPVEEQVTVLVVDDNADALQLFQRYLWRTRYRFLGAQDVQRGLALAEELSPGIIVIDIMMPGRDGWMLLAQLREHPKISGTPIVVCSILPQEELAHALGAAEFIRKPIGRKDFLSALDRQLGRSQRESC